VLEEKPQDAEKDDNHSILSVEPYGIPEEPLLGTPIASRFHHKIRRTTKTRKKEYDIIGLLAYLFAFAGSSRRRSAACPECHCEVAFDQFIFESADAV
jgi:hypothetical protein